MKLFEYRSAFIEYNSQREMDAKLSEMGKEGWELFHIEIETFLDLKQLSSSCFVIFKKTKDEHSEKMSKLFNYIRGIFHRL